MLFIYVGVHCLFHLTELGPESLGHSLLSSQSQWSTHTLQSHRHLSGPAWEVSRAFICFSSTVFLKSDLLLWYPVPQGTFLYLEVHETGTLCLVGNKGTWTQDRTKPRTCYLLRGQIDLSLISHTASGTKIILPTKTPKIYCWTCILNFWCVNIPSSPWQMFFQQSLQSVLSEASLHVLVLCHQCNGPTLLMEADQSQSIIHDRM